MKKIELAFALGLAICILGSALQLPFSRNCAQVREDTLRLHIVANSDSDADQTVKLAVRDALLENSETLLAGAHDKAEAVALVSTHVKDIAALAAQVLEQNGFSYRVIVYVTEMYFEQRSYENITLPAGYYSALRIELGAAVGHNWWCVVYPTLCVPSASEDALDDYSDAERDVVTDDDGRYVYRFKVEEWLQSLFHK